jgi:hypothetical protein
MLNNVLKAAGSIAWFVGGLLCIRSDGMGRSRDSFLPTGWDIFTTTKTCSSPELLSVGLPGDK